jgi:hypothetical protein
MRVRLNEAKAAEIIHADVRDDPEGWAKKKGV